MEDNNQENQEVNIEKSDETIQKENALQLQENIKNKQKFDEYEDDRPIGGGKMNIPEYASEIEPTKIQYDDQKPKGEKKLVVPRYPDGEEQPQDFNKFDEKLIDRGKKLNISKFPPCQAQNFDEILVGGGKKQDIPEYPPCQEPHTTKQLLDERPMGDGKKMNIPVFPTGQEPQIQKQLSDKRPIGGGKEMNILEFPPEQDPQKQDFMDERPLGGQKMQIPEYPPGQEPQVNEQLLNERPLGGQKMQIPEYPSGQEPQINKQLSDERLLGGQKMNIPEYSIGQEPQINKQLSDERPLGGQKMNIPEFPPDDIPPPLSKKKITKKVVKKPEPKQEPIDEDRPIAQNIDEQILITKGVYNLDALSEFPEPAQEDQDEDPKGPIIDRIKSKNFKDRQRAFEDLIKEIENNPNPNLYSEFSEWESYMAVNALRLYLELKPRPQINTGPVIKNLVEKCIAPGKPAIKKYSYEVLYNIYEKDQQTVLDNLLVLINNKNPKVQLAAFSSIQDLLTNYGPKKMQNLKPFLSEFEKIAGSTNAGAKKCVMDLYKEMYKWMGDKLVEGLLSNLKQVQKDELKGWFEGWEKQIMVPLKGGDEGVKQGAAGGGAAEVIDLYDMVEAKDIFKIYNEKWCDQVLAIEKWKEKCDKLDLFIKESNITKIAPGQFHHVISFLKKLLNDSNANIQICAIKITGNLAAGLRKPFAAAIKTLFSILLGKFRDKKTLIIEETKIAIDKIYYCQSPEDLADDIKEGILDKTPAMKIQVMNYIDRALAKYPDKIPPKLKEFFAKQIILVFPKLFQDSVAEVRDCALALLGKYQGLVEHDDFQKAISNLNDAKKSKLLEAKYKQEKNENAEEEKEENNAPQEKQAKESTNVKMKTELVQRKHEKMEKTEKKAVQEDKQEDENVQIPTYEDAEQAVMDILGDDKLIKQLESTKAADKTEAFQSLKDNKDTLLNDSLDKTVFIEKMGDVKFNTILQNLLERFCESVLPKFVILQLLNKLGKDAKKNNPKTNQEFVKQINNIIDLCTVKYIPLKETILYGKELMNNSNNMWESGIELMKKLYEQLGKDLDHFINDVNPKTLEGEAAQEVKDNKNAFLNPLDSLPRVDISNEANKLLKKLSDGNWKVRKEGLDGLEGILSGANNRIKIDGLFDLIGTLKARINDPNKSLVRGFTTFAGRFVEACGVPIKPHSKVIVLAVIGHLSDKQAQIRQEANIAIDKISPVVGSDMVINCMQAYLSEDSIEMKMNILQWIVNNPDGFKKADQKSFISPILTCLTDKNKDVRSVAEKVLEMTIPDVGVDNFRQASKDLKPAFVSMVAPLLIKYGDGPEEEVTQNLNATAPIQRKVKGKSSHTVINHPQKPSTASQSNQSNNMKKSAIIPKQTMFTETSESSPFKTLDLSKSNVIQPNSDYQMNIDIDYSTSQSMVMNNAQIQQMQQQIMMLQKQQSFYDPNVQPVFLDNSYVPTSTSISSLKLKRVKYDEDNI